MRPFHAALLALAVLAVPAAGAEQAPRPPQAPALAPRPLPFPPRSLSHCDCGVGGPCTCDCLGRPCECGVTRCTCYFPDVTKARKPIVLPRRMPVGPAAPAPVFFAAPAFASPFVGRGMMQGCAGGS